MELLKHIENMWLDINIFISNILFWSSDKYSIKYKYKNWSGNNMYHTTY